MCLAYSLSYFIFQLAILVALPVVPYEVQADVMEPALLDMLSKLQPTPASVCKYSTVTYHPIHLLCSAMSDFVLLVVTMHCVPFVNKVFSVRYLE